MPTIQEQITAADRRGLIRKIQRATAMIAPASEVELPKSLYQDGELIDLKAAGFKPVGIVTSDGYSFAREVESETIDGLGYSIVRKDVTEAARSITFTMQETGRKHIQELLYGTDLTGVTQDPTTGEIVFDEPDIPIQRDFRLIVVGTDGPPEAQWIIGRGYHTVQMDTTAEQVWGKEGALTQEITLTVLSGEESGVPVTHYLAGTGPLKYAEELGFDKAAA